MILASPHNTVSYLADLVANQSKYLQKIAKEKDIMADNLADMTLAAKLLADTEYMDYLESIPEERLQNSLDLLGAKTGYNLAKKFRKVSAK